MTDTGWQVIGRIAKERRERLGLKQDELALYEGPRVATVGKFERAAQANFPLRTQHQIEKALGWSRGSIEQFVSAYEDGDLDMSDWMHDLVEENIPDLSRPAIPSKEADDPEVTAAIEAIGGILRLVEPERLGDAVRDGVGAMLPYLVVSGPRPLALGRALRDHFPPEGGDGNADDADGRPASTSEAGHTPHLRAARKVDHKTERERNAGSGFAPDPEGPENGA